MDSILTTKEKVDALKSKMTDYRVEGKVIAIVGKDSENWPSAMIAAGELASSVIPLKEGMELHFYKRALNEFHCDVLMHSRDYQELAYRVDNDGVTLVSAYLDFDKVLDLEEGSMYIDA